MPWYMRLIMALRPHPMPHYGCQGRWDIHPALAHDLDRQPVFDDYGDCVEDVVDRDGNYCEFHWLDLK